MENIIIWSPYLNSIIYLYVGFLFLQLGKEGQTRFGYKTRLALQNENTFKAANNYAGKLMLLASAIALTIGLIWNNFFILTEKKDLVKGINILLLVLMTKLLGITVLLCTESFLRKRFGKESNQKSAKE